MAQISSNKCETCSENSGNKFCRECQKYLCAQCRIYHDKFTKGHTVTDSNSASKYVIKAKMFCESHDLGFLHFCDACKCLTCLKCTTSNHKGHAFTDIAEKAAATREILIELCKNLKSKSSTLSDMFMQVNNEQLRKIQEDTNIFKAAAQETRENFESVVKQVAEFSMTHANDYLEIEKQDLKFTITQIQKLDIECKTESAKIEQLLEEKHDLTFYIQQKDLIQNVEAMNEIPKINEPRKLCNFDKDKFADDVFERIQYKYKLRVMKDKDIQLEQCIAELQNEKKNATKQKDLAVKILKEKELIATELKDERQKLSEIQASHAKVMKDKDDQLKQFIAELQNEKKDATKQKDLADTKMAKILKEKELIATELKDKRQKLGEMQASHVNLAAGRYFVVAIDFGTNYSGFAFSAKGDTSIYTQDWTNGDLTSIKTPTSLLLDKDKKFKAFGYEADKIYLSTILPGEEMHKYYYFRRFKMMLHKEKVTLQSEIKEECGKKMKAIDIFSISIKYLKDQAYKKIKSRFLDIHETDIQYVLTVPAICADQARLFMRKAAEKAGILSDQLTLALEPEAASIYCQELKTDIEQLTHPFMETIKSGMQFMVINLGGVTADITVYQRHSEDTLDEILQASGGPWGGTAVDQAYMDFLHTLFSKEVLDDLLEDDLEDYCQLFHEFEVKKRSIEVKSKTDIRITMPVGLMEIIKKKKGPINDQIKKTKFKSSVYAEGQKLHINPETFRSLFHQTIQNLLAHLDKLFKDRKLLNLKNIIMVGGFSECELVQLAVKNRFGKDKQIIIPDGASLAVLKGAVLFGHHLLITGKH